MRTRFNRNAVASSDGNHIRILHDIPAGKSPKRQPTVYARIGFFGGLSPVTETQAAMLAPCQRVYKL